MIPTHDRDIAKVEKLVRRHVARAPDPVKTAMAWAPSPENLTNWGAWLVAPLSWDGVPDEKGLVRWQPTSWVHKGALPPCDPGIPPLLRAYLKSLHTFEVPIWDGERTWLLPPVLEQNRLFHFRQITGAWIHLYRTARFSALCESRCGKWIACSERRGAEAGEDAPVWAFRHKDLYQLEPRLFAFEKEDDEAYELVKPLGTLIADSFRDLLTEGCTKACPPWDDWKSPHERTSAGNHQKFRWRDIVRPAPNEGEPLKEPWPDPSEDEVDPHIDRIAAKIEHLKACDPAYLIWGAESHRYRMEPTSTAAAIRAFERTERCAVPTAYRQFLRRVGNGGRGPWRWLRRLEHSGAEWAWFWQSTSGPDVGRMALPFPHASAWQPDVASMSDDERQEYGHSKHIRGAILLGEATDASMVTANLLLVVSGNERGHIWSDLRSFGEGLIPIVNRGPYSFLAWYENGLDGDLQNIDKVYEEHIVRTQKFVRTNKPQR